MRSGYVVPDVNWGGPGFCSYDGFLKVSQAEKDAQAQSAAESKQLQDMMNTQFKESQALLNNVLIPQLTAMATDPQGFGAKALAAMQSTLINTVGTQLSSQEKSLQNQFATSNMAGLSSGVQAAIQANLAGNAAGAEAGGLSNIAIENAQLKNQQQQYALSGLNAASASLNQAPGTMSGAISSNEQRFQQAKTIASQGSLWQNILGGVVGAGLNFATGGISGMLQGGSFLAGGGQALGGQPVTG